jgi:predicted porin
MKKHLIAAAVAAAVAAPAMAQNVEVYGRIDTGISGSKTQGYDVEDDVITQNKESGIGKANGLAQSRIGFRGTEDLGGGLKAAFVLESEAVIAAGSGLLAGGTREASAAVSGGFGTVKLGRFTNIGKVMKDSFTAFAGGGSFNMGSSTIQALSGNVKFLGDAVDGGNGDEDQAAIANLLGDSLAATNRNNNLINYTSPTFNGFQFQGEVRGNKSKDRGDEGANDTTGSAFRLSYNAGPLSLAVARTDYTRKIEGGATLAGARTLTDVTVAEDTRILTDGSTKTETEVLQVGATYTLGATKLFFTYADSESKVSDDGDLDGLKFTGKGYDVGITHTIGATTLLASVGNGSFKASGDGSYKTDLSNYMVQASYALSKRTALYAFYQNGKADLDDNDGKLKDRAYMAGIVHTF